MSAQRGGILCSEQASSRPACPTANTHNIVVGSRKSCLLRMCGLMLDYGRRPGRLRSNKHKHKFARHTRMATLCRDRIMTCLPMCKPIIWYRLANVLLQQAAPRAPGMSSELACASTCCRLASRDLCACISAQLDMRNPCMPVSFQVRYLRPAQLCTGTAMPALARNMSLRQTRFAFRFDPIPFTLPPHRRASSRPKGGTSGRALPKAAVVQLTCHSCLSAQLFF